MPNPLFGSVSPRRAPKGGGSDPRAAGGAAPMPEKPGPAGGLPGKGGPDRSAGVPRKGASSGAPFEVKKEGF